MKVIINGAEYLPAKEPARADEAATSYPGGFRSGELVRVIGVKLSCAKEALLDQTGIVVCYNKPNYGVRFPGWQGGHSLSELLYGEQQSSGQWLKRAELVPANSYD